MHLRKVFPHINRTIYAVFRGVDGSSKRSKLVALFTTQKLAKREVRRLKKKHAVSPRGGQIGPRYVVVSYHR